jgi:hypothetical protein
MASATIIDASRIIFFISVPFFGFVMVASWLGFLALISPLVFLPLPRGDSVNGHEQIRRACANNATRQFSLSELV